MAANHSHEHMAEWHFNRGRAIAERSRRDDEFDTAHAFQRAAKSAAQVGVAVHHVRDAKRFMDLARRHATNLIELPVREDDPEAA